MAILSFADGEAESFFCEGVLPRKRAWGLLAAIVRRKLDVIHYAGDVRDLAAVPGNRLEKLKGDLGHLHSIRINDQWRITFQWTDLGAAAVRIVDYH